MSPHGPADTTTSFICPPRCTPSIRCRSHPVRWTVSSCLRWRSEFPFWRHFTRPWPRRGSCLRRLFGTSDPGSIKRNLNRLERRDGRLALAEYGRYDREQNRKTLHGFCHRGVFFSSHLRRQSVREGQGTQVVSSGNEMRRLARKPAPAPSRPAPRQPGCGVLRCTNWVRSPGGVQTARGEQRGVRRTRLRTSRAWQYVRHSASRYLHFT